MVKKNAQNSKKIICNFFAAAESDDEKQNNGESSAREDLLAPPTEEGGGSPSSSGGGGGGGGFGAKDISRRFERQSWRERHAEERRRLKHRFEVSRHIPRLHSPIPADPFPDPILRY